MSSSLLLRALVSVSLGLVACGGATLDDVSAGSPPGSTTTAPPGSSTPPHPTPRPPTTNPPTQPPSEGVVIPKDATIVLENKGGFAANGDQTICTVIDETYTYEVASRTLSWKRCVTNAANTKNDFVVGKRALAPAESGKLDAALAALQIVRALSTTCGSDKPAETLVLTSPSALTPEIFYDTFYHCSEDGLVHASGLDDVHDAMYVLTN